MTIKNSPTEGTDTSIPSFCSDADHEGKNGSRVLKPNDVAYLKSYISSLLKSFHRVEEENRLLRLQLEDLRYKQVTKMESERWM